MSTSIKDIPKARGRPFSGGRKAGILVRLPDDLLDALDAFSAVDTASPDASIGRPEAIRRIIREWLTEYGYLKS